MSSRRALDSIVLVFGLAMINCNPTAETQPSSTTTASEPGPEPSTATPEPVPIEPDAIAIGDGYDFACALQRAGTVACWGINTHGQLGQLHREPVDGAVLVHNLDDAVALAVSGAAACAARRSGSVLCWGKANRGLLGNGSEYDYRGFVEVLGVRDATALVTDLSTFCASTPSGQWCWGSMTILSPVNGLKSFREQDPVRLALDGVRALNLDNSRAYAYREDGSVLAWGDREEPVELHGIVEASSSYEMECLARTSGEVTCRNNSDKAERVITSLRGAHHIFLSRQFIAGILPDGSLAGESIDPESPPPYFADAHGLVALTSGDTDQLYGLRSDGRVFLWEHEIGRNTAGAREIQLPSPSTLGSPKAAPSLPDAPIRRWCTIETRIVSPVDIGPILDREPLCNSVDIHSESSDCPEAGPWFEQQPDGWIALVVPTGTGQFGRLPELARHIEGKEKSSQIEGLEVRSSSPVDAWLLMHEGEGFCLGEERNACGLSDIDGKHHIVITGLVDGTFLITRATIDMWKAGKKHIAPARVTVAGDIVDVWACGGHARVPLVAGAAVVASNTTDPIAPDPTAPDPALSPPSALEAAFAADRCDEGWSKFKAGQLAAAKQEVDAALTVLERAQDAKGRRSLGACLYNRGRIAEQEGEIADARELYRRSLAVRPNDTVSARLDSLSAE